MYTVPLGAILRHHTIGYHIYADDTQLYLCMDTQNASTTLEKLRTAISDVHSWMITNKLKINDYKTEFLVITKTHLVSTIKDLKMEIRSHLVVVSKDTKNLGVYFDSTLSMKRQINCVSSSMLYHLRNIRSIRGLLTQEVTAMLIHSLVTSRLDYCNILYHGIPDKQLNKLQ